MQYKFSYNLNLWNRLLVRVQILEVFMLQIHCADGSSDDTIVPFVDHTFDKYRTVLVIRKAENLKYKEVILPENVNIKKSANHAECYRKFTALGRNAPPKNDDVQSKSVHTRSKRTLASGPSSTGIIPKI